jgi:hypothetical protein
VVLRYETEDAATVLGTEQRLAAFTELVATTIANTQARQELSAIAEEQSALRRVAVLVARGEPPHALFGAVAEEIGLLLPADAAVLSRYDPDGCLTRVGRWSIPGVTLPPGARSPSVTPAESSRLPSATTGSAELTPRAAPV